MNTQEFIESGILELYAMGQCTAAERQEVQRMLELHPLLREELNEIEKALLEYAQQNAVQPSAKVKSEVLKFIQEENKNIATPVVELTPTKRKFNWLAAASIAMLLGSAGLNYVQYKKYTDVKSELAQMKDENSFMANNLNVTRAGYNESQRMLAFIGDEFTKAIPLKGVPNHEDEKVTIYWNTNSRDVYAAINNLALPEKGKSYQLWAIVDGAPVNAGIIEVVPEAPVEDRGTLDTPFLQKMEAFYSAQIFAITIEKEGGSKTPTLENVVVMGKVDS